MEAEFSWNFEQEPWSDPHDETSVNLRAYFDRMPNPKMKEYCPEWTDEQVMEWDDSFRSDGACFWSAPNATWKSASTGGFWKSAGSTGDAWKPEVAR